MSDCKLPWCNLWLFCSGFVGVLEWGWVWVKTVKSSCFAFSNHLKPALMRHSGKFYCSVSILNTSQLHCLMLVKVEYNSTGWYVNDTKSFGVCAWGGGGLWRCQRLAARPIMPAHVFMYWWIIQVIFIHKVITINTEVKQSALKEHTKKSK